MKVLLVNGSPRANGCTNAALTEIEKTLNSQGIETTRFHIGTAPVQGCVSCYRCREINRCVFDDAANECIGLIRKSDGVIVGSPVYYGSANGALCALLDRVFFAGSKEYFAYKPAAAIVACRRGGASAAFDRLNKYFTISEMPVVSSQYWNSIHGTSPNEVAHDKEGLRVMRALAKNMAWMLQNIQNSRGTVSLPEREERVMTNFIREI